MSGQLPDLEAWTCPLPLRDYPRVVLGHGGGGQLSDELVEHLFGPAFGNPLLDVRGDSCVVSAPGGRLAVSTDGFVVRPLLFPGGSIGELAVNGTVNDLAMSGAVPQYLTAGFIIEEGLEMATLGAVVARMAAAARRAGVQIIAGDTKVVERGHGDGLYITTAGLGFVPAQLPRISPEQARPGDAVIVSGTIGDHGIAVMSVRESLAFETLIESDCAPLHTLVQAIVDARGHVHVLRDPTQGRAGGDAQRSGAALAGQPHRRGPVRAGEAAGASRVRPARARPVARGQRGQAGGDCRARRGRRGTRAPAGASPGT